MADRDPRELPFLNRKHLSFEGAAVFTLRLQVRSVNATNLRLSGITKDGFFSFRFAAGSAGSTQEQDFRISDIPIYLTVDDEGATLEQGETWANVKLLINSDVSYNLCSGLITRFQGISYPISSISLARPGQGKIDTQSSANPAAGAQISDTVDSNQIWRIIGGSFTLVTGATAAARQVHLEFVTSGGAQISCLASTTQADSLTRLYSFGAWGVLPVASEDNDILIPIPPNIILTEGDTIRTTLTNGIASDDFSAMTMTFERMFR